MLDDLVKLNGHRGRSNWPKSKKLAQAAPVCCWYVVVVIVGGGGVGVGVAIGLDNPPLNHPPQPFCPKFRFFFFPLPHPFRSLFKIWRVFSWKCGHPFVAMDYPNCVFGFSGVIL